MIVTVTPNPALDLTYLLVGETGRPGDPAGAGRASGEPAEQGPSAGDRSGNAPGQPFPDVGGVARASGSLLEPGGKGVNVSRWLVGRDLPTLAVFPAGGPTGDLLTVLVDRVGIPFRAVRQQAWTRVNTSLVMAAGRVPKVNSPGRSTPAEAADLVAAVELALAGERGRTPCPPWLTVCGSLPAGVPVGLVTELVAVARRHRVRVAVDTSGPALAAALDAGADLLAPTVAELAEICPELRGVSPGDPRGLVDAVRGPARRYRCELVVSAGPAGAVWTDGRRAVHAPAPAAAVVNTVGAGDVLLASWLAGALRDGGGSGRPELAAVTDRLTRAVADATAACLASGTLGSLPTGGGPGGQDGLPAAGVAGVGVAGVGAAGSGAVGRRHGTSEGTVW